MQVSNASLRERGGQARGPAESVHITIESSLGPSEKRSGRPVTQAKCPPPSAGTLPVRARPFALTHRALSRRREPRRLAADLRREVGRRHRRARSRPLGEAQHHLLLTLLVEVAVRLRVRADRFRTPRRRLQHRPPALRSPRRRPPHRPRRPAPRQRRNSLQPRRPRRPHRRLPSPWRRRAPPRGWRQRARRAPRRAPSPVALRAALLPAPRAPRRGPGCARVRKGGRGGWSFKDVRRPPRRKVWRGCACSPPPRHPATCRRQLETTVYINEIEMRSSRLKYNDVQNTDAVIPKNKRRFMPAAAAVAAAAARARALARGRARG